MPVYTVSQVTRYLRESLERDSLLGDLWVSGEVSSLSRSALGHAYFNLKEGSAQIRCVLFRGSDRGGGELSDGASVSAHGRVSLYEARGDLQLYVDLVRPEGLGERFLELERLKLRLREEGLFDPSRKRPVPPFPQRLGVITSPTGAVWRDIQNVAARRYPLVELVLAPCRVQGEEAVDSIVEAFAVMNAEPGIDAVILARGGGSAEELWAFNEEKVVRAIFASRSPVISAVGHETDVTVADLVADLRAPTPSAAAELAVPDSRELLATVAARARAIHVEMEDLLERWAASVGVQRERLARRAPPVAGMRQAVDDLLRQAARTTRAWVDARGERLGGLRARLLSLDPGAVLRRGYAIVSLDDGRVVTSPRQAERGERLGIRVAEGAFGATADGHPPVPPAPPA